MQFNMPELRALQAAHLLSLVPDPESDLLIANYLPAAQYGKEWDAHSVLLDCRGIIIRPDGTVHAKPFRKFGNPGEFPGTSLEELAARGAPEVAHKMDGSLIVAFHDPNTGAIRFSTRGSFTSDQAKHAARIWAERYSQVRIPSGCTYLFELIAPYNRIVVSYQEEDLVLIGVVRTETGYELPYSDVQSAAAYGALSYGMLRSVATEDIDWRSLHTVERPNFEGFVLYWPGDGLRVKVKLAEYVRLHRLVTGLSEHVIWEALHRDGAIELRREIPEELWSWFDMVAAGLVGPFSRHASAVDGIYFDILRKGLNPADRAHRKEIAAHINSHVGAELRGACFARIDDKDWHTPIWRLLEPRGNQMTTTPVAARAEAS